MNRTAVLTQGSIPQQLIWLTLPLICGNILQQLYNTVDAFIIGRFLGSTAFGAVGVAGTVMNLFIFILSGCCTGIAVLFAQCYGSRDLAAFRRSSRRKPSSSSRTWTRRLSAGWVMNRF